MKFRSSIINFPKFIIFFILLINLFFQKSLAANDNHPIGTRSAGMANAYVMIWDIWSVYHNQAGLAAIENLTIGFHHENKFIVPQYGLQALALVVPTKSGTFGLTYSYFGFSKYNESKFGLAFGRSFGKAFSVGIQLDYLNTYIAEEYGNQGALTVEGGILAEPIENFFIGAHIYNPIKAKISTYDIEKIPTIFRVGLGYNFADKLFFGIETEKDLDTKSVFKAGIEYRIPENLFLRTGILTNPTQFTFGLGYEIKGLKADIAFTKHQILGFTPHFSIIYEFK